MVDVLAAEAALADGDHGHLAVGPEKPGPTGCSTFLMCCLISDFRFRWHNEHKQVIMMKVTFTLVIES
jgi:hypothetical protein